MNDPVFEVPLTCYYEDCHHHWSENVKQLVVDADPHEKAMGPEIRHIVEGSLTCPKCHRTFAVEGDVVEYPEGVQETFNLRPLPLVD